MTTIREYPYEYYEKKLGVQGRFLFDGKNAHPDSLCLIGERGFQMRIERQKIVRLRAQAPGMPMLVWWETLPYPWQQNLVRTWGEAHKVIEQSLFTRNFVRDMDAFQFYSLFKFDDGVGLTREKIDEYTLNASVLNACATMYEKRRAYRASLGHGVSVSWQLVAAECNRFRMEELAHTLPENERRLRDKLNAYKRNGYAELIHKGHRKSNALKVDDEHMQLLNNLFTGIDHKPTYAEVAEVYEGFLAGQVEVINEVSGELYKPSDFTSLSVSTVYNHLAKWENEISNHLSRSGDRQRYMSLFKPYHKLLQPKFASSIISIDDRQPVFEYEKGKRAWFYNAIDLGSEAFTCWVYGVDKEGIILDFYRQLVRNYVMWGLKLPAELEGESNLNSSFLDTFLQEGRMFEHVRIEANNARGKRIEQYYRPLRYKYEKKREGWLARPFARSEANQARTDKKTYIPYEEIIAGCLKDIETWNNAEHSKIKGMSRWDVFLAMQNPNLRPINWHGILTYLGFKVKTSVNAGIIRFRNDKYLLGMDGMICTGDKLIAMMMQVEGKQIEIYYLDDHQGNVMKAHIYLGDRYVCDAVAMPGYNRARIEQTPEDLYNRELMSKYVTTIESFGRRGKNALEKLTVIDNRPVRIGNSFTVIDPMMRSSYVPSTDPAKVLSADPEREADTLAAITQTTFNKSLINTF